MGNPLSQVTPSFIAGAFSIRMALMPVAFLILLAGFYIRNASVRSPNDFVGILVRLILVSIVIGMLPMIGDMIQGIINGVVKTAGFNPQLNVLGDYQQALYTKFSTQGNKQNPFSWFFNGADQIGITILLATVFILSQISMVILYLTQFAQLVMYYYEIAFSPMFIAAIMVPALVQKATWFLSAFVSVCMWTLGWIAADLVTKILIDQAVNTTNSPGTSAANLIALNPIWWIAIPVWVIASSFLAPFIIYKTFTGGGHGIHLLLGGIFNNLSGGNRMVQSTLASGMRTTSAVNAMTAAPRITSPVRNMAVRP